MPTGLNFTASGFAYWGNDIGGWRVAAADHDSDPAAAAGSLGRPRRGRPEQ
ncbi:hypothetical protein ACRAWD_30755 [Caulobacter segnis]